MQKASEARPVNYNAKAVGALLGPTSRTRRDSCVDDSGGNGRRKEAKGSDEEVLPQSLRIFPAGLSTEENR
jgi:hypothetical protein